MRHPWDTVAYLTQGHELSTTKSREALEIASRLELPLRENPKRPSHWMTRAGGGVLARGVGGPLTGMGVNLMFLDDPYKNRKEADSPVTREQIWEWFTTVALTRVEPGGSCIVVHARWNEDDIIGRLTRESGDIWEHINLPALSDDDQPLWPTRWPIKALRAKEREVGPFDWASMYQGHP
jgi:hypothetical protein